MAGRVALAVIINSKFNLAPEMNIPCFGPSKRGTFLTSLQGCIHGVSETRYIHFSPPSGKFLIAFLISPALIARAGDYLCNHCNNVMRHCQSEPFAHARDIAHRQMLTNKG